MSVSTEKAMAAPSTAVKQKISRLKTLTILTSALPLAMTLPAAAQSSIVDRGCPAAAITQALEQLLSIDAFQRLVACRNAAVLPLTQLLEDEDQDSLSRRVAARALGQIGSQEAIAALVQAAQARHGDIRSSALRAIEDITDATAVPVLIDAVANQDLEVSRSAMAALHRIDPALPGQVISNLWEAVRSSNLQRRSTVRFLLDQLSSRSEPDISRVTQALSSEDEATRSIAAYVLVQRGREAQAAIPMLTRTLADPSQPVRDTAAYALGRMGSREAIGALLSGLRSEDEAMQTSAGIGLSALSANARESVPILIAALRDQNERVRGVVAYALGQVGTDARRATPALIGGLSDRSAAVRGAAADALGQVNPNNSSVIWALVRRVTADPDPTVRDSAAYALTQLTPEAIPTLFEIFASSNTKEAEFAAYLLLEFGAAVDSSLIRERMSLILTGVSRVATSDSYYSNSNRAAFADYVFKQLGSDAVPILIASLQNQNEDIRVGATLSLVIGEEYFDRQSTDAAIPILRRTFHNSRLSTLWQRENRALVTAVLGTDESIDAQAVETALASVEEIVFGDRLGLPSLLALMYLTQGEFWDELERENAAALRLISLFLSVATADVVELSAAARTYQANNRPAVCRLPIARFLWRCR